MPHVIIKMYEGRTLEQKVKLADTVARDVAEIAGCAESAVSVAVEDFDPAEWAEAVYRPDILGRSADLVRPPGYNPFE